MRREHLGKSRNGKQVLCANVGKQTHCGEKSEDMCHERRGRRNFRKVIG